MKLRNKTTGEIVHIWEIIIEGRAYNSLAEIKENYEDINPPEPLIKDDEIRKAIRSWAEINTITNVIYDSAWNAFRQHDFTICFGYDFERKDGLEDNRVYTITELCGEED